MWLSARSSHPELTTTATHEHNNLEKSTESCLQPNAGKYTLERPRIGVAQKPLEIRANTAHEQNPLQISMESHLKKRRLLKPTQKKAASTKKK
eukprot:586221-Karenia_brevis.AAC.1